VALKKSYNKIEVLGTTTSVAGMLYVTVSVTDSRAVKLAGFGED